MRALLALMFLGLIGEVFAMNALEDKKKIVIISSMNAAEIEAFYALLEKENPDIDGSFRPTSFDETDVVAYFLDSWNDVEIAPGAQELPEIFDRVKNVKSPTISYSLFVELSDGRDLNFIFYSTSDTGYAPLKCFARDLAIEASRKAGEVFENDTLSNCINL